MCPPHDHSTGDWDHDDDGEDHGAMQGGAVHIHSVDSACVIMPRDLPAHQVTRFGHIERKHTRLRRRRDRLELNVGTPSVASAAGPMIPGAGKDLEQNRAQHKNSGKNSEVLVHGCQRRPMCARARKRHVNQPSLYFTYHSSWSSISILSAVQLNFESMYIHLHLRDFIAQVNARERSQ